MNHNLYRLLNEVIKFLEISQEYVLNSKINLSTYMEITEFKFRFLGDILQEFNPNPKLVARISKLFINNDNILNSSTSVTGN